MAVVGTAKNARITVYGGSRYVIANIRVNGTTYYDVTVRSVSATQKIDKVLNGVRSTLASIPADGGGTQNFVITAENNRITSNTGLDVYDSAIDVVGDWNVVIGTLVSFENLDTIAVTGVTVAPTSATLTVGNTQQLTATVAPADATNKAVSWSSSDTNVATVNSIGLVTAVAAGNATITVTTTDGSKTATCAIVVNTPTYTVTYNANGGTGTITPVVGTYQNTATSGFTRSGYALTGWNTAADGSGTAYALGAQITLTGDITLYAVWTELTYGKVAIDGAYHDVVGRQICVSDEWRTVVSAQIIVDGAWRDV